MPVTGSKSRVSYPADADDAPQSHFYTRVSADRVKVVSCFIWMRYGEGLREFTLFVHDAALLPVQNCPSPEIPDTALLGINYRSG